MRIIGKGFSAGKKLFSMLNIPYPSKCTYRQHEIKLLHAASQAANNSMLESEKSIAECSNECGVSVDGTWQKCGYSSLNGCVSTISVDSGKILDIEVLSQYCRVCTKTEKTSGFSKKCVVSHFCKNHKGSASNMETVGAYRIFERSEANRSLRYTSYYGGGDSKAFNNVKDIYGYDSVVKYECIGHVQKRVGSRLRKLKKSTKGLGGKGKLTDKFIDTLQNYFGIAIRSNVGNLCNMQTAVIAAFFHCCSTDKKPMHGQCPSGSDTWCKYQKAKQEGKLYKHRTAGLPNAVLNTVKTTYMDLCDQSLLEKR
ncbi:uncharacterized protein TNCV_894811 [Trichonephila clavipes]|nr:uncharacterized protein TNCV_894811 [Trichonephila clavipes]